MICFKFLCNLKKGVFSVFTYEYAPRSALFHKIYEVYCVIYCILQISNVSLSEENWPGQQNKLLFIVFQCPIAFQSYF